jgi:hypothetical protein
MKLKILYRPCREVLDTGGGKNLSNLEQERNKYLKAKEELWRQRSRAIWIQSGDQNTKFFHQFSSHRRNQKHIWEILDDTGTLHTGQEELKEEAVKYFKNFFKAQEQPSTIDQVRVVSLFSWLVNEEEARILHGPVNMGELKEVLTLFKKDKSPGPDGWTIEFFIHFFDLVGEDLLEMVEESRSRGFIVGSLNSTFLALIPKVNKPVTFGDFRPISLCNLVYKLISKIIANQIKPILSRSLFAEQLGFLKGRQIQDAIGTTHECLHSIKKKIKIPYTEVGSTESLRLHKLGFFKVDFNSSGFWYSDDQLDYELCSFLVLCCFT